MSGVDTNTGPKVESSIPAIRMDAPQAHPSDFAADRISSILSNPDQAIRSIATDVDKWKETPAGLSVPAATPEQSYINPPALESPALTPISLDTSTDPAASKPPEITSPALEPAPTLKPGELTNTLNDMDRVIPSNDPRATENTPTPKLDAAPNLNDTLNDPEFVDRSVPPQRPETSASAEPNSPEKIAEAEELTDKQRLDALNTSWREKARLGEDPSDDMIAFMELDAKMQGLTLPESAKDGVRETIGGAYREGVLPQIEGKHSEDIKAEFAKLGQLEAEIVALKKLLEDMKEKMKSYKDKAQEAENGYLKEDNPTERMIKLADYRTKTAQLQGYQMAINDSAARGRQANIDRFQAAGKIHRKLGTQSVFKNVLFGARTAIYQASDAFQDVTIDHVRNNFGLA